MVKLRNNAGTGRGTWQSTFMLRNVPNRYSKQELLHDLAPLGFKNGKGIGYVHLPLDPKTSANRGYAFVTVKTLQAAERLRSLKGGRLDRYPTKKILDVTEGTLGGSIPQQEMGEGTLGGSIPQQEMGSEPVDQFESDADHQLDDPFRGFSNNHQFLDHQTRENHQQENTLDNLIEKSEKRFSFSTDSTRSDSQWSNGSKRGGLSSNQSQISTKSSRDFDHRFDAQESSNAQSPFTSDDNLENAELAYEERTGKNADHSLQQVGISTMDLETDNQPGATLDQHDDSRTDDKNITTFMIRNIRNRYSQTELLSMLGKIGFRPAIDFDFFYVPKNPKTGGNFGYGFINFTDAERVSNFLRLHHETRPEFFQEKVEYVTDSVSPAKVQGFEATVKSYQHIKAPRGERARPLFWKAIPKDGASECAEPLLPEDSFVEAPQPPFSPTSASPASHHVPMQPFPPEQAALDESKSMKNGHVMNPPNASPNDSTFQNIDDNDSFLSEKQQGGVLWTKNDAPAHDNGIQGVRSETDMELSVQQHQAPTPTHYISLPSFLSLPAPFAAPGATKKTLTSSTQDSTEVLEKSVKNKDDGADANAFFMPQYPPPGAHAPHPAGHVFHDQRQHAREGQAYGGEHQYGYRRIGEGAGEPYCPKPIQRPPTKQQEYEKWNWDEASVIQKNGFLYAGKEQYYNMNGHDENVYHNNSHILPEQQIQSPAGENRVLMRKKKENKTSVVACTWTGTTPVSTWSVATLLEPAKVPVNTAFFNTSLKITST